MQDCRPSPLCDTCNGFTWGNYWNFQHAISCGISEEGEHTIQMICHPEKDYMKTRGAAGACSISEWRIPVSVDRTLQALQVIVLAVFGAVD